MNQVYLLGLVLLPGRESIGRYRRIHVLLGMVRCLHGEIEAQTWQMRTVPISMLQYFGKTCLSRATVVGREHPSWLGLYKHTA